jgi:TonB-linked SusC/RagA family outer membrane protein
MKLILFFLLLSSNLVWARQTYAQVTSLNLDLTNVPLEEVFDAIRRQSEFEFFYNNDQVNTTVKVSVNAKSADINAVLEQVLPAIYEYKINDRYILINKRKEIAPALSPQPQPQQAKKTITGIVIDKDGETIIGANIVEKGTAANGTITDVNGEFTLNVSDNAVLQVSYVGYITQEIKIERQTVLYITLQEDSQTLDEMVVVAFSTQKKASVIGSITTVNPAELKIPSSNLTSALAGNMAGIIAYQRSGEPGVDNVDFFVRGITTFAEGGMSNPLILIDGVELTTTDLARLQPDDIASFSIMKDATATALYGARGANGVILVTTKEGREGETKIFLRFENSISTPTQNIELADPITFMKLHNEAYLTRNPLAELPYSQEKIDNTLKPGSNPYIFPANDWRNMLFRDHASSQRVTLNVSGGGRVARYYVSGSFTQDNGLLKVDKRNSFNNNINAKNYSLRTNFNVNITRTTKLNVRLTGNFDDYTGPLASGEDVYKSLMGANPVMFPAYFPVDKEHEYVNHIMFGNYKNEYLNPYAEMIKGYRNTSRSQMLAQLEGVQNLGFITEGLTLRAMINISRLANYDVSRQYSPYYYQVSSYDISTGRYRIDVTNPDRGTAYLNLVPGDRNLQSTMYSEATLNYGRTFDKHTVGALLVAIARENLSPPKSGDVQLSIPSRNAGLSGRATYAFDDRYFLEFNFGYNGSERFAAKHRFGFFPSAGAAWMISNEKFWENLKPTLSTLKLRYSYGLVGNDKIGGDNDRFFYLSNVNMTDVGKAALFGVERVAEIPYGVTIRQYADENITWEIAKKQNFALEIGLWEKLDIIAEYFTEHRRNIFMTRVSIPSTMGIETTYPIRANVGEATGNGFDLSADYNQSWTKDFWTSARLNFTYAVGKYKVFEEPDYPEKWRLHSGRPINQWEGYIAERLFVDDAEARNSPPQNFGSEYGGGDIKYTDVNRDGQITPADRVFIGNPTTPEIIYGFGLSAGFKGFDISMFFQGLANESFWINTAETAPFIRRGATQTQLLKHYADSHWSESNQDVYALWPRFDYQLNANNNQVSTYFMRDGSFLRLKQTEIGYTVPGKWQDKLSISNLRIYLSGTNLLLFSKFKLWDPEMAGNGLGYPIQRVFNMGINLTFN